MKTSLLSKLMRESNADDFLFIKIDSDLLHIRFAANSITSAGNTLSSSFYFISIIKGKVGIASIDHLEKFQDAIKMIRKSEQIANQSVLAEDYYTLLTKDADAQAEDLESFESTLKPEGGLLPLSQRVSTLLKKLDEYSNTGYAKYSRTKIYLANSRGIRKEYVNNHAYLGVTTKTKGLKKSVWHARGAHNIYGLDIDELISETKTDFSHADKTLHINPGRYTVILSPVAVADLLIEMVGMMSMKEADEGRSPFSSTDDTKRNKIGEKLFPESISIGSSPSLHAIRSIPFFCTSESSEFASIFDNGAMVKDEEWIKEGTLKQLITTRQYAARKQLDHAAFSPTNLYMKGSLQSIETLIKNTKSGLLINSLWYIREVDPASGLLTGLTRDGVYVIEDGKIVGMCNNFRFNESPIQMLKHTVDLSKSYITVARENEGEELYEVPYVKVKEFNLSSSSEAI